ncbi:MAG: DedA family protein [Bacteroidales bacterium]|jgi:membrane protein DedA with SNARE-associated domain|nr:DedA family protein [Bacteroidales bacterium]
MGNNDNDSIAQPKKNIISKVITWYSDHLNYASVTALMTIESSFIPFPSEIVVPPAAYAACSEDSNLHVADSNLLNVLLVVLFSTLGALLGALINYYLALFLGRPIIYWFSDSKVGHLLLLSKEKVVKAEDYFIEHGKISTFIGRLLPVIRQLISIPAGLAKMKMFSFVLYTTLGAFIWNLLLALLGYITHGQKVLIDKYSQELSWILMGVGVIFVGYLILKGLKKRMAKA